MQKLIQYVRLLRAYILSCGGRQWRASRIRRSVIEGSTIAFSPALAAAIGTNEALIVQKVFDWMSFNERKGRRDHYIGGEWWTYNSYAEWHEKEFTWMSLATVKRLFQKLKRMGILKGQQQRRTDARLWYTVNQAVLEGYLKESPPVSKRVPAGDSSRPRGARKSPSSKGESSKGNHTVGRHSTNIIITPPPEDDVHEPESETGELETDGEAASAVSRIEGDGRDRNPAETPPPAPAAPSPASALLAAQGVTEPALTQLVELYSEMDIVQAVAHMGRQESVDNPPGWIVNCLREGWHKNRPRTAPRQRAAADGERYVPGQYDAYLKS